MSLNSRNYLYFNIFRVPIQFIRRFCC